MIWDDMEDVEVEVSGHLSERFKRLHEQVFGWRENYSSSSSSNTRLSDDGRSRGEVDLVAWKERMVPGRSWAITTEHGFLAAHERGDGVVNVWLMGVAPCARGKGEFSELIKALLSNVPMISTLTMTTFPKKFSKMFRILSTFAERCDHPEDTVIGKARFSISAWKLYIIIHRRAILSSFSLSMSALACAALMMQHRSNGGQRQHVASKSFFF